MAPALLAPAAQAAEQTRRSGPRVVAVVPAYNEQDGIAKTVRSLLAQSVPVHRVLVVANNCSDRTAEAARDAGAEVLELPVNPGKKAGALNAALDVVLPTLEEDDYVLCQDADGELSVDFVRNALAMYDRIDNLGGLSGAIVARPAANVVELAQAIDYARFTRLMARKKGKVYVLSGAATIFPVSVLRDVAASRGATLPGEPGRYLVEHSLAEDYELTLAIRTLGYRTTSTKTCPVTTDLMRNVGELKAQRLRWYRGALESLWLYGFTRVTAQSWGGVAVTYLSSLLLPAMLLLLAYAYLTWGATPNVWALALLPLFVAEKVVAARRVSRAAVVAAVLFVPLWLYDNALSVLYWRALFQTLRGSARVWVT